jgi:hypothetical protein
MPAFRGVVPVLALILTLALAAAACGSDGPEPAATPASNGDGGEAGNGSPAATPTGTAGGGAGAAGSVAIDGAVHAVNDVLRCEPPPGTDRALDITGAGPGFQVFVYISEDSHEVSLQGSAAGGIFSGAAWTFDGGESWTGNGDAGLSEAPLAWADGRVRGTLVVADAEGGEETRTVTVDLAVPSTSVNC